MRHKLSLGRPCLETNAVGDMACVATMLVSFGVLHPPIQPGPSLMLSVFPARTPPSPCNPNLPTALKRGEGASKDDASVEPVFAFALQTQPRHPSQSPFAAPKHTPRRVFAVPLWLNRINWPIGPWNWVLTDAVRALSFRLLLDSGNFEINATGSGNAIGII